MFAFTHTGSEARVPVYCADEQKQRSNIFRDIRQIETRLEQSRADWPPRMAKWEDSVMSGQPDWIVVRPSVDDISTGGQKNQPLPDGPLLAGGYAPASPRATFTIQNHVPHITPLRRALLSPPTHPVHGPGASGNTT